MSVYNCSEYLEQAIDSILNQSFRDFEFIIVDDCSTDKSLDIISSYLVKDSRIKLLQNSQNIGLTKSLNKALSVVQGEYVARQDGDDVSLPERFQKQVKYLDENPNAVLVSGSYQYINSQNLITGKQIIEDSPEVVSWYLNFYNRIGAHSLVMFRRSALAPTEGYDENFRYSQDYELWLRLRQRGKLVMLPDVLQYYRRDHSDSISVRSKPEQERLSLMASQIALKQLTENDFSLEDIKDLKAFWLRCQFSEIIHPSKVNHQLRFIYQSFLNNYLKSNVYQDEVACQIKFLLEERYLLWLMEIDPKQKPLLNLQICFWATRWNKKIPLKFWLNYLKAQLKKPLKRLLLWQS